MTDVCLPSRSALHINEEGVLALRLFFDLEMLHVKVTDVDAFSTPYSAGTTSTTILP